MCAKFFRVVLALFRQNPDVTVNFTDDELTEQILEAKDKYNKKHENQKSIEKVEITPGTINLTMRIIVPSPDTKIELHRMVTYFSRYLYKNCDWSRYSSVETRLFTLIEGVEIKVDETAADAITALAQSSKATADNELLKKERLRWLYATKTFIETEIKILEQEGVKI